MNFPLFKALRGEHRNPNLPVDPLVAAIVERCEREGWTAFAAEFVEVACRLGVEGYLGGRRPSSPPPPPRKR